MELCIVFNLDHVSLYFVLLAVYYVFHVDKGIFMTIMFGHGKAGTDGLNKIKFTSRIFLSVRFDEKLGRETDGKRDWICSNAC